MNTLDGLVLLLFETSSSRRNRLGKLLESQGAELVSPLTLDAAMQAVGRFSFSAAVIGGYPTTDQVILTRLRDLGLPIIHLRERREDAKSVQVPNVCTGDAEADWIIERLNDMRRAGIC